MKKHGDFYSIINLIKIHLNIFLNKKTFSSMVIEKTNILN